MILYLETTMLAPTKHNAKLLTAAGRLVANATRKTPERAESVAREQAAKVLEGFEFTVRKRAVELLNGKPGR